MENEILQQILGELKEMKGEIKDIKESQAVVEQSVSDIGHKQNVFASMLRQTDRNLAVLQSETKQELSKLDDRLSVLEQGQAKLEQGQEKLEQGQTKLEQGQAKLERGQAAIRKDIAALNLEMKYAFDDIAMGDVRAKNLVLQHEREYHHAV